MQRLDRLLTRVGQSSPLVPALSYFVVLILTHLATWLAPELALVRLVAVALWLLTALLVFVTVTWYRADDWLAAGFLLGMTMLLSAWVDFLLLRTLATGALADALVWSVAAPLTLLFRALLVVPIWGAAVVVARRISGHFAGRRRAGAIAPPA